MKLFSKSEIETIFASPKKIVSSAFPAVKPLCRPITGRGVERNSHSFPEIMLTLSGKAELSLGDKLYSCTSGTLFLFNSREIHDSGYSPRASDGRHFWIFPLSTYFVGTLIQVKNGSWSKNKRVLIHHPDLMNCLNFCWQKCYKKPNEFTRERLLAMIKILLLTASDMMINGVPATEESQQSQAIAAVMQHLNITLGVGDSIKDLMRLSGYSRPHFMRIFRQHAGCTVGEYINLQRVTALRRFESSNLLRKEIADKLGFSSSAALAHWQKKIEKRKNNQYSN